MERPKVTDADVKEEAIDRKMDSVMKWGVHDEDKASVKVILMRHVEYFREPFQVCRDLDVCEGWYGINQDFLDIIENIQDEMGNVWREKVKKWVVDENIGTEYKIGDMVKFKLRDGAPEGEIVKIDAEYGQCLVFCETLGHVREGVGTHGNYVDFEKIIKKLEV